MLQVQQCCQENAALRQQLNRLWNNQKEQHAQAQQLSGAVAEERQQRQQLEGTVAALQQQVQQLLSAASLITDTNGASQPDPAAAAQAAGAAHNAASTAQ